MKIRTLTATILLGMTVTASAVAAPHGTDFKDLMRKELDAWSTMDTEKAAPFYAQGPNNVLFELTTLKCNGWAEFGADVKKAFADMTSIQFTIHDDVQVHQQGHLAWGTATVRDEVVTKAGQHEAIEARWTVIWEKQGKNWLIVHEHFSAPAT